MKVHFHSFTSYVELIGLVSCLKANYGSAGNDNRKILLNGLIVKINIPTKYFEGADLSRRLSVEMLHRRVDFEKQDFGKLSSTFQDPADEKLRFEALTTNHCCKLYSTIEDYG